jgi:hypothetical protein
METMDDFARAAGFNDERDMHQTIAATDLTTPERLVAFLKWREGDGTKAGLLALGGSPRVCLAEQRREGDFGWCVERAGVAVAYFRHESDALAFAKTAPAAAAAPMETL